MHAGLSDNDRMLVMEDFKAGSTRVLISTDLDGPKIEVEKVNLVINYDMPQNVENYLKRIGHRGRQKCNDIAVNFVADSSDAQRISEIEKHYNFLIEELPANVQNFL
eukprot:gnl/MRDRNA2_/MRDRNA2_485697_c0_seq1.p1 gnl/MRDRNA2_/MRDRNA2_485697_c0~~gnl/MRDRNA2_/MRDRNA2_485697_c0_seq1.p1  ORF type:complete len:119 (-),score=29.25 gnl/MRDRNA2_/MRDRNA2_485697_c0_seq1:70-390(-)